MKVHVVTTAVIGSPLRKERLDICRASVRAQQGVEVDHTVIVRPERTKLENLVEAVRELAPEDVVALVDGDDRLAHPKALLRIAKEHERGAWLTYGSSVDEAGKRHDAPYSTIAYRRSAFRASHLKTFRAGLLQRIRDEDLHYPSGRWIDLADDVVLMIPMLEIAGPSRIRYVHEVLYLYSRDTCWWKSVDANEQRRFYKVIESLRDKAVYERVERL